MARIWPWVGKTIPVAAKGSQQDSPFPSRPRLRKLRLSTARGRMTPSVQLDVLDLRHFNARQLRPLLEEESEQWRQRLLWDYSQSSRLLLDYMDSRILPGYVALDHGRVRGYCFAVYEATKAILGEIFAAAASADQSSAQEVEAWLLGHILPLLQTAPGIERVESQLLLHPSDRHTDTFRRAGFHIYPRLFMICDINTLCARTRAEATEPHPENLHLRHWQQSDLPLAGELIVRGYQSHMDSLINSQYLTVTGAMRFLHNIIQFPGCGTFDAPASWMLLDRPTGLLAGLLLCSLVSPEAAHITQLCIAPEMRRRGLATLLTAQSAAALARKNIRCVTLTVTEANQSAVRLYQQMGFTTHHRFDAMVWTA
jgi:ribosomal protein S18 acetylase RimI-like enzyme